MQCNEFKEDITVAKRKRNLVSIYIAKQNTKITRVTVHHLHEPDNL